MICWNLRILKTCCHILLANATQLREIILPIEKPGSNDNLANPSLAPLFKLFFTDSEFNFPNCTIQLRVEFIVFPFILFNHFTSQLLGTQTICKDIRLHTFFLSSLLECITNLQLIEPYSNPQTIATELKKNRARSFPCNWFLQTVEITFSVSRSFESFKWTRDQIFNYEIFIFFQANGLWLTIKQFCFATEWWKSLQNYARERNTSKVLLCIQCD